MSTCECWCHVTPSKHDDCHELELEIKIKKKTKKVQSTVLPGISSWRYGDH